MRCAACDCELTSFESTRKSTVTGEYVDLCAGCFSYVANVFSTNENFGLFDAATDTMDFDTTPEDTQNVLIVPSKTDDSDGDNHEDKM